MKENKGSHFIFLHTKSSDMTPNPDEIKATKYEPATSFVTNLIFEGEINDGNAMSINIKNKPIKACFPVFPFSCNNELFLKIVPIKKNGIAVSAESRYIGSIISYLERVAPNIPKAITAQNLKATDLFIR
jgi:hypothetical protein